MALVVLSTGRSATLLVCRPSPRAPRRRAFPRSAAAAGADSEAQTQLAVVNKLWRRVSDGDVRDAVIALGALQVLRQLATARLTPARREAALGVLDKLNAPDTEREVELATGADPSAFVRSDARSNFALLLGSLATAIAMRSFDVPFVTLFAGVFVAVAPAVYIDEFFTEGLGRAKLFEALAGREGRRRRAVHEAGHLVAAYMAGYALRGVSVDAGGMAWSGGGGGGGGELSAGGVVFWDDEMARSVIAAAERAEAGTRGGGGGIPRRIFDRFSVVLFAGVAAEALVLGSSEGGDHDEAVFRALAPGVQPREAGGGQGKTDPPGAPLSATGAGKGDARIGTNSETSTVGAGCVSGSEAGNARWALSEAYLCLRQQRRALDAVASEIEAGNGLSACVAALEANFTLDLSPKS